MRKVTNFCDYFVIAGGSSTRKVKAIVEGIEEGLSKKGEKIYSREGVSESLWVLLDCADVIVHIFYSPLREYYALERLWADALRVKISQVSKK